jgi:hypothetical protein
MTAIAQLGSVSAACLPALPKILGCLTTTVLVLNPAVAIAQQPKPTPSPSPSPSSSPSTPNFKQITDMFGQMGPMYESMTQGMLEGTLKTLDQTKTIERIASFNRRYYEALIKQGFTKDEALQIVVGVGVPGVLTGR